MKVRDKQLDAVKGFAIIIVMLGHCIGRNNMNDPYAPIPSGTRGTVDFVDDVGQIHMKWDNGRTLAIVPQVDKFRKLTQQELLDEQGTVPTQEMSCDMV